MKASAAVSEKISCESLHEPFVEKLERTLCACVRVRACVCVCVCVYVCGWKMKQSVGMGWRQDTDAGFEGKGSTYDSSVWYENSEKHSVWYENSEKQLSLHIVKRMGKINTW